jgi:hypothetical protein
VTANSSGLALGDGAAVTDGDCSAAAAADCDDVDEEEQADDIRLAAKPIATNSPTARSPRIRRP